MFGKYLTEFPFEFRSGEHYKFLAHGLLPATSINTVNGKGKGCLESRSHDNECPRDFTLPLARWAPMKPATINPTLDLCTRYPLRLGGPWQCGL